MSPSKTTKGSSATCHIGEIKETPPACFQDLEYQLWVRNADLIVEYDSAGFIPKRLFDVMMLRKDPIFYGDTDVVYCIGRDMQRPWRIEKKKDPTTAPFYHASLPVYSWMLGSVTTNTYQFDEQTMWIGTTSGCDKQVYDVFDAIECTRPRALLSQLLVTILRICSCRTI